MTGDQSSDINHRGLIRRVKLETRVGGAGSVITSICISSLGRGAAVCLSVRQSAPRRAATASVPTFVVLLCV